MFVKYFCINFVIENDETMRKACKLCDGEGYIDCMYCGGTGTYHIDDCPACNFSCGKRCHYEDDLPIEVQCDECNGKGYLICDECNGEGYIEV